MERLLFERSKARPRQLDKPPPNLMLVDPDYRSFDPYNSAADTGRKVSGPVEFIDETGGTWIGDRAVCFHRVTKIEGRELVCQQCRQPL